jgi:RES domain-containing protein
MEVFRLARERYASPLSGKGAAIKGARWNSAGVELIYTALNRSLAMAEVAVHFTFATLPDDYIMLTIHVPDDISFLKISPKELPAEWRDFPHPLNTQRIGDQFVAENRKCIMVIPSVITQGDFNVLINPNHPEFKRIRVVSAEKFPFDKRLFK